MWIDVDESSLGALRATGWKCVPRGKGKTYLVAPGGMRLEGIKSSPPLNLYVVHARRSTRFKIGISRTPHERIYTMRIGSPLGLDLVYTAKIASPEVERKAHALLARSRSHGEWFDLGRHAISFLADLKNCQTLAAALAVFERLGGTSWQSGWKPRGKPV